MKVQIPLEVRARNLSMLANITLVAATFCISAAMLFQNAFRYSVPLGYAGLYAQMAEGISEASFRLPMEVPFYGPGGIPFAYPPLALYAVAALLKLGVPTLTVLRFLPAVLSLLALVPLFLLVRGFSKSVLGASAGTLLAAFSPALYVSHTLAAGVVRALAFLWLLLAMRALQQALAKDRPALAALSGFFWGLSLLTHLFYAYFFLLWMAACLLAYMHRRSWRAGLLCALTAAVVASPWVFTMASRYGVDIFAKAFFSHDNAFWAAAWPDLLKWLAVQLSPVLSTPLTGLLVAAGLVGLLLRRQFGLPLAFLASVLVLSPDGARFIDLLGALLAGSSVVLLRSPPPALLGRARLIRFGILAAATTAAAASGVRQIDQMYPSLHQGAFGVQDFVRQNLPAKIRYLLVAGQGEAEWFPYLLQREPVLSKWGSEWLGTYYEQRDLQASVTACQREQSVECLQRLGLPLRTGDLLITRKSEQRLAEQLERAYPACRRLNTISLYILWWADCLVELPAAGDSGAGRPPPRA